MNRNTDRSRLVCDSSCDSLTNPPCCIGRKFISLAVVKFFHSFDQTKVTFLDQIKEKSANIAKAVAALEELIGEVDE